MVPICLVTFFFSALNQNRLQYHGMFGELVSSGPAIALQFTVDRKWTSYSIQVLKKSYTASVFMYCLETHIFLLIVC